MLATSTKKGATNGKTTTVAQARPKPGAGRKTRTAKRKGTASIPVGTQPAVIHLTNAERQAAIQRPNYARSCIDREQPTVGPTPASHPGFSDKAVYRAAASGLILFGLLVGYVVGRILT